MASGSTAARGATRPAIRVHGRLYSPQEVSAHVLVHMTRATRDLADFVLPASARLQRRRLREGSATHQPLYDEKTLEVQSYLYLTHELEEPFDVTGLRAGAPIGAYNASKAAVDASVGTKAVARMPVAAPPIVSALGSNMVPAATTRARTGVGLSAPSRVISRASRAAASTEATALEVSSPVWSVPDAVTTTCSAKPATSPSNSMT